MPPCYYSCAFSFRHWPSHRVHYSHSVATRSLGFSSSLRLRFTLQNGYLLSKFLQTPTSSLTPVTYLGTFRRALLQFIYFRSVSGCHLRGRGHLCQNTSFVAGVVSTVFIQAWLGFKSQSPSSSL